MFSFSNSVTGEKHINYVDLLHTKKYTVPMKSLPILLFLQINHDIIVNPI